LRIEDRLALSLGTQSRLSDREIFARFPLYLVPTYPGDHTLFASPGFQAWLPRDLPLIRTELETIMEME
jgi:hypothetical protein